MPVLLAAIWIALLAYSSAARAQQREVARYAIVIGVNKPPADLKPRLDPLQYATHDALKMFEVLRNAGANVSLLADADGETEAQFAWTTKGAEMLWPLRANLDAALTRVKASAEADLIAGKEVHLYFYFSGHGRFDAKHARGELVLSDGTFSRTDLYEKIVGAFKNTPREGFYYPHIILDACFARSIATSKGSALLKAALAPAEDERIDRHPNAGLLLAVNRDGTVPESSALRASVFSHALVSALLGLAEVDGDESAVSYDEAAAFVRAANSGVESSDPHVDVYVRPPQDKGTRALLPYPPDGANVTRLALGGEPFSGRLWVADEKRIRWFDSNIDGQAAPSACLSPGRRYFLTLQAPAVASSTQAGAAAPRVTQRWFELDAVSGQVSAPLERSEPPEVLKSSTDTGGLFSVPYGKQTFDLLRSAANPSDQALELVQAELFQEPEPPAATPPITARWWFWTGIGVAVAGGVIAGVLLSSEQDPGCPTDVECRIPK